MTTETTAYLAYGFLLDEDEDSVGYPDTFAEEVDATKDLCLECHGDSCGVQRLLCVKETVIKEEGLPYLVPSSWLEADVSRWDNRLREFIEGRGIKSTGPSWFLFHTRL